MKKNQLTWILLAVLGLVLAAYFLFVHNKQNSSYSNANFAIEDTASLTKIVLTHVNKGEKKVAILLEKQADSTWKLNEKYPVLEPQLHYFFKAITQLKVKEKLSDAANETALQRFDNYHLLVEFFNGKDRVHAYQVGTESKDHQGSIMRVEGASKAFNVSIPGFSGIINARFPTELQYWRENLLFDARIQNLQSVEVQNNKFPTSSFSFARNDAKSPWTLNGKQVDSTVTKGYFRNLRTKVYAETFASNDFPNVYTELKDKTPDFLYKVKYLNGKERKIRLYLRPDNKNSFFGWVEGEDNLLTIQHFVFDRFINVEGKEQIMFE